MSISCPTSFRHSISRQLSCIERASSRGPRPSLLWLRLAGSAAGAKGILAAHRGELGTSLSAVLPQVRSWHHGAGAPRRAGWSPARPWPAHGLGALSRLRRRTDRVLARCPFTAQLVPSRRRGSRGRIGGRTAGPLDHPFSRYKPSAPGPRCPSCLSSFRVKHGSLPGLRSTSAGARCSFTTPGHRWNG